MFLRGVNGANFNALELAGSCDIGNVTFSGFNTSLTASGVLVSTDGGVSTGLDNLLGFSYTYLGGSTFGLLGGALLASGFSAKDSDGRFRRRLDTAGNGAARHLLLLRSGRFTLRAAGIDRARSI